ncbi:protein-methionine-sulfoxide reductase catalytic subunit MsrP [Chloroflexi bacterium TSY]|nr:protein-methionine-sulfoxide reductase catalytic subunit MsrP [Chloroflexi bacterium TSY]
MNKIRSSEITPEHIYLNRRKFMVGAGLAVGAATVAACAGINPISRSGSSAPAASGDQAVAQATLDIELPNALNYAEPFASSDTDELGDPLNNFEQITNHNNYYEFTTDKARVNPLSQGFDPYPWTVEVGGLVNNPKTFAIEDLITMYNQEERIYRLRCVEAWSMVIPWVGFSLADLLKEVDPKSEAKYVYFESVLRPEQMPGQTSRWINWPYKEGLRLDEAMHPLTLMSTGMYGKLLTNPNGAPLRLVVPWKYGFKSIKGIVKIELTDTMPTSTWMEQAPNEYGFYANVNPEVNHPRWSQATERRVGAGLSGRRETLMFNGYGEEVASLYDGLDLRANY